VSPTAAAIAREEMVAEVVGRQHRLGIGGVADGRVEVDPGVERGVGVLDRRHRAGRRHHRVIDALHLALTLSRRAGGPGENLPPPTLPSAAGSRARLGLSLPRPEA
jgi:hypothetical protein